MENTQTKSSKKYMKPISSFYKHSCDTCNYYTNYKNSYNKHIKSAKHLSLNPVCSVEETEVLQTETTEHIVDEVAEISRDLQNEHYETETEVIMDASMGFITVEEIKRDTIPTEDVQLSHNERQLDKIVDLMDSLNKNIKKELKIKYFFTGMGFFFNFVLCNFILFQLFVRSQGSNFFKLSG